MAPGELAVCGTEACLVRFSMKDVVVALTDKSLLHRDGAAMLLWPLIVVVVVKEEEEELEDEALLMLDVRPTCEIRPFLVPPLL